MKCFPKINNPLDDEDCVFYILLVTKSEQKLGEAEVHITPNVYINSSRHRRLEDRMPNWSQARHACNSAYPHTHT